MRDIAAIEVGILATELDAAIKGLHIKKFYELGDGTFRILFYGHSKYASLYINAPKTINLTEYAEPAYSPTGFTMAMRKRIDNAVATSVKQINGDRIIAIDIDKGDKELIIELFGKANMILIDNEMKVEACLNTITQKERAIRPGLTYKYPAKMAEDLLSAKDEQIEGLLKGIKLEKNVTASISRVLNVGPLYIEDAIMRCGIDPKAKSVTVDELEKIAVELILTKERIKIQKPRIYFQDGAPVDYAICEIKKYDQFEKKEFDNISALLDFLCVGDRSVVIDKQREDRLKELNMNVEKQLMLAEELVKDSASSKQTGHAMMANMVKLNQIIQYLQNNRRATLEEVKQHFPNAKIKTVDLKNKTVTIEVE